MTWDRWLPRILWVSSLGSSLRPEHAEMYRKHETSNRTTQEMHKMSNKSADTWNIMKLNLFHFFKTWKISSKLRSTTVWCSMMQWSCGHDWWAFRLKLVADKNDFVHPGITWLQPHPPSHGAGITLEKHSMRLLWEPPAETIGELFPVTQQDQYEGLTDEHSLVEFWSGFQPMLHTTAGRPRQIQSTGWTCSWATLLIHCSIPVCSRCLPLAIHIKIVGLGVLVKEV